MDMSSEDAEGNIIPLGNVMFMTGCAEAYGFEPLEETDDPNADQMQAFLRDSFVFAIQGVTGFNPDAEELGIILAIPQAAMMYMIQTAMERIAKEQGHVPGVTPNLDAVPKPPTSPGGIILPN